MASFELLLMRHAQAEDYAAGGDSERALTAQGRETAAMMGRALKAMGLNFDGAVVSPFRRACETAGLVMAELWFEEEWPTDATLTPGAPPDETIETLVAHAQNLSNSAPRLLAVGHNPSITATLGQLVVGDPGVYFSVAPGDVAHLWVDQTPAGARAAVLGFYPSKQLARLVPRP